MDAEVASEATPDKTFHAPRACARHQPLLAEIPNATPRASPCAQSQIEHHPREAPWFYGVFSLTLIAGGVIVTSGADLVKLSVAEN